MKARTRALLSFRGVESRVSSWTKCFVLLWLHGGSVPGKGRGHFTKPRAAGALRVQVGSGHTRQHQPESARQLLARGFFLAFSCLTPQSTGYWLAALRRLAVVGDCSLWRWTLLQDSGGAPRCIERHLQGLSWSEKWGRFCVAEGPVREVSVAGAESSALHVVRLASRKAIHTAPSPNHVRILRPQV